MDDTIDSQGDVEVLINATVQVQVRTGPTFRELCETDRKLNTAYYARMPELELSVSVNEKPLNKYKFHANYKLSVPRTLKSRRKGWKRKTRPQCRYFCHR